jgi:hypothetical protein
VTLAGGAAQVVVHRIRLVFAEKPMACRMRSFPKASGGHLAGPAGKSSVGIVVLTAPCSVLLAIPLMENWNSRPVLVASADSLNADKHNATTGEAWDNPAGFAWKSPGHAFWETLLEKSRPL